MSRSQRQLKSDAEKKTTKSGDVEMNVSQAAGADLPAESVSSELASERMWEDVSDVSETSGSSYSADLSTPPAAITRVTVVGNGLIQVSAADPLLPRFSLGSDDRLEWKAGDDLGKHGYLWDSGDDVIGEQECKHESAEDPSVSLTDLDGRPRRLVQLQNILPLFIFGTDKEGSRSVRFAVIGDHEINSDHPISGERYDNEMVSGTDSLPSNNHLLTKSASA